MGFDRGHRQQQIFLEITLAVGQFVFKDEIDRRLRLSVDGLNRPRADDPTCQHESDRVSEFAKANGDVEFEYLHILPNLPEGVIVHVHDIFSPREYPEKWLKEDRRFWNEQYLLEAFLSFNQEFEIISSLNHMMHLGQFQTAFPVLAECGPLELVGSFWFRRVSRH